MYIHNMNNVKAVAIMLDGCILDLNRYRYNYYKTLCKDNNISINKQMFYDNLNSQYTMYNSLPLCDKYSSSQINQKIEDDIFAYLKHKGTYTKEGLFELLNYFHQKNIQVAIMSTHRTKRAIEYLKMTRVYSHVHYIIGSDTNYKPLPSSQMLEAICDQFKINHDQLLVISPFLSLNLTANDFQSHVIYYQDLIEPTALERASSIKTVHSFFEILNFFLLEKSYDSHIYSSLLGMSNQMNKEQLDEVNDHLKEVYHDDEQILNIVQDTYEYHLSQLNEKETIHDIKEEKKEHEDINLDEFDYFEDKDEEILLNEEEHQNVISLNKEQELELTSAWNKLIEKEQNTNKEDIEEEKIINVKDKTNNHYLLYIISEFIYSLTLSFIILFVGIIIFLLAKDKLIQIDFLVSFFNQYLSFIESITKYLFDFLHSLLSFIPSYNQYLSNHLFSQDGIVLFHLFVFHFVIIFLIKMIYMIIKKDSIFNEE